MERKDEVFVPVKGYENRFKISNYGRLISFNRVGRGRVLPQEVEMKCTIDKAGYRSTTLRMFGRKRWCVRIHTLVAMHFVENSKPGEYDTVNHMDGNKLNNYAGNLEWCTNGMNTAHAFRTGLVNFKGTNSVHAKLTETDVLEMRRKYATGNYTQSQLAKPFGMSRRHIGDILNRVCWLHI